MRAVISDHRLTNRYRVLSAAVFLLAVLFWLFFDLGKHAPVLAAANPFLEDPYDAVGSFAVQLAGLTALLGLLRALRPYPDSILPHRQAQLILRSAAVTVVSIGVTLAVDSGAMLRFPHVWLGTPGARLLDGMGAGLTLLTALTGFAVYQQIRVERMPFRLTGGVWASGLTKVALLGLAFYPPGWRQSIPGAILSALAGMVLFFLIVWGWSASVFPSFGQPDQDVLDDLAAVGGWLKARLGWVKPLLNGLEKLTHRRALRWFNPRCRPWALPLLLGALAGAGMLLLEFSMEGGGLDAERLALVLSVYVGIETAGVLLGYALLGRFLGLFRDEKEMNG